MHDLNNFGLKEMIICWIFLRQSGANSESMSPIDKGESVREQVNRSLGIIDESGVVFWLNPMETLLEAEFDEFIAVVKQMLPTMRADCKCITCDIKID